MKGKLILAAVLAELFTTVASPAAVVLGLSKGGSSSDQITLAQESSSYTIDLSLNSDGNAVSGLQLYLTYSTLNGSGTPVYGAMPLVARETPFLGSDVNLAPEPGDAINSSEQTIFFKSTAGDYLAFSGPIATYEFNITGLGVGT